jgi:hypothetical protein
MAWYWPDVYTPKRAETAARVGAWLCFCIAVLDGLLVARDLYLRAVIGPETSIVDILRFNVSLTLPLLGCVLFTVAGWRIWNLSRTWVVIVLVWYLFQTIRTLGILPLLFPPSLVLALVLITTLRGTLAYHRLTEAMAEAGSAAVAGHTSVPTAD